MAGALAHEIKALLIGQSADPATVARMRGFLERQNGVEKLFGLLTLQLGSSVMVAVKARMKGGTADELVDAINRCETAMRAEFPEIQWLFFEPDVRD